MRALTVPPLSPRLLWPLAVCALAVVTGGALLGSAKILEGQWLIAPMAGLTVLLLAVASGRFERVLLALLFLAIPVNADVHFSPGVAWDSLHLPGGTARLGISVIDVLLLFLYPVWIMRMLASRRSLAGVWPAGATALVGLIGWSVVSMLNAREPMLSVFFLVGLLRGFALFFYLANRITTRKDIRLAVCCLVGGLILECGIAFAQYLAGSNLGLGALGEREVESELELSAGTVFRIGGTLGHPNSLGGYLAAVLPVVWALNLARLRLAWRLVVAGASVFGTVILVLTLSRSAWLCAGLAGLVLVGYLGFSGKLYRHLVPMGFVAVVLGATLLGFSPLIRERLFERDTGAAASRLPQNRIALTMIRSHPVLGVGSNNYGMVQHLHEPYVADQAPGNIVMKYQGRVHNVYLMLAAETGLVGLAWLGWFLWIVLRQGWRRIAAAPDRLVQLVLVGMLIGLFARALHETVHTGHLVKNLFLWIYPAILVAGSKPIDNPSGQPALVGPD